MAVSPGCRGDSVPAPPPAPVTPEPRRSRNRATLPVGIRGSVALFWVDGCERGLTPLA